MGNNSRLRNEDLVRVRTNYTIGLEDILKSLRIVDDRIFFNSVLDRTTEKILVEKLRRMSIESLSYIIKELVKIPDEDHPNKFAKLISSKVVRDVFIEKGIEGYIILHHWRWSMADAGEFIRGFLFGASSSVVESITGLFNLLIILGEKIINVEVDDFNKAIDEYDAAKLKSFLNKAMDSIAMLLPSLITLIKKEFKELDDRFEKALFDLDFEELGKIFGMFFAEILPSPKGIKFFEKASIPKLKRKVLIMSFAVKQIHLKELMKKIINFQSVVIFMSKKGHSLHISMHGFALRKRSGVVQIISTTEKVPTIKAVMPEKYAKNISVPKTNSTPVKIKKKEVDVAENVEQFMPVQVLDNILFDEKLDRLTLGYAMIIASAIDNISDTSTKTLLKILRESPTELRGKAAKLGTKLDTAVGIQVKELLQNLDGYQFHAKKKFKDLPFGQSFLGRSTTSVLDEIMDKIKRSGDNWDDFEGLAFKSKEQKDKVLRSLQAYKTKVQTYEKNTKKSKNTMFVKKIDDQEPDFLMRFPDGDIGIGDVTGNKEGWHMGKTALYEYIANNGRMTGLHSDINFRLVDKMANDFKYVKKFVQVPVLEAGSELRNTYAR